MATMEITPIHKEKISHFTFHGKKRADHESRKHPLPAKRIYILTYYRNQSYIKSESLRRTVEAVIASNLNSLT